MLLNMPALFDTCPAVKLFAHVIPTGAESIPTKPARYSLAIVVVAVAADDGAVTEFPVPELIFSSGLAASPETPVTVITPVALPVQLAITLAVAPVTLGRENMYSLPPVPVTGPTSGLRATLFHVTPMLL